MAKITGIEVKIRADQDIIRKISPIIDKRLQLNVDSQVNALFGLEHAMLQEEKLISQNMPCVVINAYVPCSEECSDFFDLLLCGLRNGMESALGRFEIEAVVRVVAHFDSSGSCPIEPIDPNDPIDPINPITSKL